MIFKNLRKFIYEVGDVQEGGSGPELSTSWQDFYQLDR